MRKGLMLLGAMLSIGSFGTTGFDRTPTFLGNKTRGQFWDKPERNRNKLNLSSSQRENLATLHGRSKKNYLKELKNA